MDNLDAMLSFDTDVTGSSSNEWFFDAGNDQRFNEEAPVRPLETPLFGVIGEEADLVSDLPSYAELLKKGDDRLALLAKEYTQKLNPNLNRDIKARIKILENEIDNACPRYTEEDWALLEKFTASVNKLRSD